MSGDNELSGGQDWCSFSGEFDLDDPSFQEILTFYLFECPVEGISTRSMLVEEFGWPSGSKKLTKTLEKYCQGKGVSYHCTYNREDLMEFLCAADLYYDLYVERQAMVFYDSEDNQAKSLLKYIRNSLAHGSFEIKSTEEDKIYIMESRAPSYNNEIRARMVIGERALLDIISIVQAGPQ